MTGVRELEHRMMLSSAWERKPKPKASGPEPKDPDSNRAYMEEVRLMYDMARLAFETDSTRLITIFLDSVNSPAIDLEGVKITDGYHNLSHHGQNPTKLAELAAIDTWHMKLLAGLLSKLKTTQEGGGLLLDRTMVLFGSNFGDANKHTTNNMPVLLAGSGSVQEFRVETSNLGPEFSRFAGGVINMISKSGTNEYHGTAYEFLRNKVLNANTFFNNRSGVATPAFTQNQFGADIGGRVIKDKTFFFVSYEGFRLRQGASTLTSVPTEAMRSGDFQISVPVPERSANILKNRLCTGIRLRSPIGRFSQGGSEASLRE